MLKNYLLQLQLKNNVTEDKRSYAMPENNAQWYALYTKPRWEKKIDTVLIRKGIECWCPLNKIERQWSDRKKIVEEPLFKSYIFVRIDMTEKADVLQTDGILNFVHYLKKPAVIKEEEIDLIKHYLAEKDASISLISKEAFEESTRIRVTHGVFMGKEGTVLKNARKKIYVKLESLGQVMVVEFPIEYLSPI